VVKAMLCGENITVKNKKKMSIKKLGKKMSQETKDAMSRSRTWQKNGSPDAIKKTADANRAGNIQKKLE